MAERLLRHALDAQEPPLASLNVASFGTGAFPGCAASENSVFALSKVGIDLDNHTSQSADQVDFSDGIAYFCMTHAHQQMLTSHWDVDPSRVFLVREWLETPPADIPDPFGMDVRAYIHCRDTIVEAIPSLIDFLSKSVKSA